MKRCLIILIAMLAFLTVDVTAQIVNPVHWSVSFKMTDDINGEIIMTASIDEGWHMYSLEVDPDVGPQPLEIEWPALTGVELQGRPVADKAPHKEYDEMFGANLSWWTGGVTVKQAFKAVKNKFTIDGLIRYSACNNDNCIPPAKEPFTLSETASIPTAVAEEPAESLPSDTTVAVAAVPAKEESTPSDLWAPVTPSGDTATDTSSTSLWYIFIACFAGGFLALLTPCVWPMIPMTVSFFLKKGKNRARAVADAITYGLSIIIIYVALGILVTAIWGPAKLNELATSAVCNIIFFVLLVVFAISFFGAFDIKLPSRWANKMDATADKTTGLLSIFFMAFTLTLVSFSCTGPIIGTLLVEAASTGDKFGPAIGMAGFALALAIPFCLFAMFPSWLQSAPKSGSWMNTVKVVLGFLELALSLKFLSVADLAYGWHILDRETFLALWIAIFGLLGAYLLGAFNFAHYGPADRSIGTVRFFLALASLSFTVYLIPGLWGAPLKSASAFVPPLYTQDFNLYGESFKEYSDYDEGMAVAREENKPVLLDFSGYGCVNCRKMEGAVLDEPDVKAMIEKNFVVIKLMVDEKRALPQPIYVEENGKQIRLDTSGERWSYLQRYKFQANAQPYYVVLNDRGELLSGPYSYDESIPRFTAFLEKGIKAFSE
ncbi:protein-disulfide reductase DsbD [uncultured Muribaculum sp.]|uniref:protein-disulfide reductase DsbD family protein n=1 Tax=uncultured Muribaculum sp. TaxID=1918613 RepID=UPI0025DBE25C|nr:cytochrome c biogenesis protein CcdA [uncultured Muribaculum sp.]